MLRPRDAAQTIIAGIIRELELARTSSLTGRCESMAWLLPGHSLPLWSRQLPRPKPNLKWFDFDVELPERLWSLWGSLHPQSSWFDSQARGRQGLACCVVACCVASVFRNLGEWTPKFLDAIIINGDKYYRDSIASGSQPLSPDDLVPECSFQDIRFMLQLQLEGFGQLYSAPARDAMGLYEALNYFFTRHQWGVLTCQRRQLAFGYSSSRNGGYFLYDCGAWGKPLFPDAMGASFVLRAKQLMLLLYCMVVSLNVRRKCVDFKLYSVEATRLNFDSIPNPPGEAKRQ